LSQQRKKESERVLAAKERWGGEALKAAKRAHTVKMRKEKAEKEAANCGSPKWEGSIEIAPGTRLFPRLFPRLTVSVTNSSIQKSRKLMNG
jgi:hypothetical protein